MPGFTPDSARRISDTVRGWEGRTRGHVSPMHEQYQNQPLRWLKLTADLAASGTAAAVFEQWSAAGIAYADAAVQSVKETTGKISAKTGDWILCRPLGTANGTIWEALAAGSPASLWTRNSSTNTLNPATSTDQVEWDEFRYQNGTTGGTANLFIGELAGPATLTGSYNFAAGYGAGQQLTSGGYNVCLGFFAGNAIATGQKNVCIGANAGKVIIASDNFALGANSLFSLTTGERNVAIGTDALYTAVASSSNVAIGWKALTTVNPTTGITGSYNVGIGTLALTALTTGYNNTGIGFEALRYGTASHSSVGIGSYAGHRQSGAGNVWIGHETGATANSGNYNVIVGYRSGYSLTNSTGRNVFIGPFAGYRQGNTADVFLLHSGGNAALADAATELTTSLLYGTFSSSTSNQQLTVNGHVRIREQIVDTSAATPSLCIDSIDTNLRKLYCGTTGAEIADWNTAGEFRVANLTATRLTFAGTNKGLTDDALLYWDAATSVLYTKYLVVTDGKIGGPNGVGGGVGTAIDVQLRKIYSGAAGAEVEVANWATSNQFRVAALTAGRVTFAGNNKELTDDSTFTYDPTAGEGLYVNNTITCNDVVVTAKIRVTAPGAPASAAAEGTAGDIAWDSSYIYVCVADDTWKRATIATW